MISGNHLNYPASTPGTPASNVHERLKTNGTATKISRETTNNQQKKNNSVKYLQILTEAIIFIHEVIIVSNNPESLCVKSLCFKTASLCLFFSKMNSWQESLKAFFLKANL